MLGSQLVQGLIVVVFAAVSAIYSSKLDLGLLSIWPVLILFIIFVRNYELGLICLVLSFAYQSAVVFAPRYGLSAYIRLDELVFAAILPIWLMKKSVESDKRISIAPLTKPLLFYVFIAFFSLVPRYQDISSTAFLQTAAGLKGLCPLLFKLAHVVVGYIILTDARISQKTRNNLFLSLPVVAAFAVTLSFLISHGLIPKNIVRGGSYDPYSWYTRFSLYGNTGAWGVLLTGYFFILLYSLIYFKPLYLKMLLFVLLILCIDSVLMSGTKTAFVGLGLGLIFLAIKAKRNFMTNAKVLFFGLIAILMGIWSLNQFASGEQKDNVSYGLRETYSNLRAVGFEEGYSETSLGGRYLCLLRFGKAVEEEPELLLLGRGWHRRVMYETGVSLHNDLLAACHDMGVLGVVFVIWIFSAMYKQFSLLGKNTVLSKEEELLRLIMQAFVIIFIASSFTSENLTLYGGGIDVQFPFVVMLMAVTWLYFKKAACGS